MYTVLDPTRSGWRMSATHPTETWTSNLWKNRTAQFHCSTSDCRASGLRAFHISACPVTCLPSWSSAARILQQHQSEFQFRRNQTTCNFFTDMFSPWIWKIFSARLEVSVILPLTASCRILLFRSWNAKFSMLMSHRAWNNRSRQVKAAKLFKYMVLEGLCYLFSSKISETVFHFHNHHLVFQKKTSENCFPIFSAEAEIYQEPKRANQVAAREMKISYFHGSEISICRQYTY